MQIKTADINRIMEIDVDTAENKIEIRHIQVGARPRSRLPDPPPYSPEEDIILLSSALTGVIRAA